jgi:hypothetical protein
MACGGQMTLKFRIENGLISGQDFGVREPS